MHLKILQIIVFDVLSFMAIGAILYRLGVLNKKRNSFLLRQVVVNTLFPCFIFANVSGKLNLETEPLIFLSFFISVGMILLNGILAIASSSFFKISTEDKGSYEYSVSFHNYGFLVIPLVLDTYGYSALPGVFVYSIAGDFMIWTFGVFLATRHHGQSNVSIKDLSKRILNPPAIAFLGGVLASNWLYGDTFMIEAGRFLYLAIPVALTVTGSVVAQALADSFDKLGQHGRLVAKMLFMKAVVCPWSLFGLGKLAGIDDPIFYIEAMMPASIGINLLADLYGGNRVAVGIFSVLSNVLASLTVPLYWYLWMS